MFELRSLNSIAIVFLFIIHGLQLGFRGRGVPGREIFLRSYKNEGTMCHVMGLVSRHVIEYNPIPQ